MPSHQEEENSLRKPAEWSQASTKSLEKAITHADNIAGIYYPTTAKSHEFEVKPESLDNLPVPPQEFWHWYATDQADYLKGGEVQASRFRNTAVRNGFTFAAGARVLDFGCSGGRVLRWFSEEARNGVEAWGCDIDAAAIEWCQKQLMPPFKFFANSTAPHLPFRDDFFDFVYAGSVINHIKDMATAWLLELGRIIKPGGYFIPTLIDEHSIPMLRVAYQRNPGSILPKYVVENDIDEEKIKRAGFLNRYSTSSPWLTGVIYSSEFFKRRAGLAFDCVEVVPALKGYQTGYVLRARSV